MSSRSSTLQGPYYDMFAMPTWGQSGGVPSFTMAYYAFNHGNMHVIVLNSEDVDRRPGGTMMTWAAADLRMVSAVFPGASDAASAAAAGGSGGHRRRRVLWRCVLLLPSASI
jgi:hypothetical protein